MFDSYAQMCCKRYHIIFSTFSLKFKCKICIQKEVIHNFKSHIFGHMTSYKLTHLKKMVRVWKTKSLLFCLRYDPLMVFWGQNHITFIFIKMMSHDLLVQMAYWFSWAKQQLCTCITLFCTFLYRHYSTKMWKCLISRFVENVNQDNGFLFLFLHIDTAS